MKHFPKVSIIIACRHICSDTSKCIEESLKLDYSDYEILILPDYNETFQADKVTVIPTGPVKPSKKRNIGMKKAKGDIFAFIDSDAYPIKNWLKNAVAYFYSNPEIGAVTGPNLTPPEDNFWQQAGGDVLASYVGLGSLSKRYQLTKRDYATKDIMSCNFIFTRETASQLNGFDESLLTGEDYKLGLEILGKGKKIIYTPSVCVYHHRRSLFLPHLKQIWNYGRDKGILMHEFFSMRKIIYFLPSLFFLWIFGGMAVAFIMGGNFMKLYIMSVFVYVVVVLAASLKKINLKRSMAVFLGICLTHLVYGAAFLKGIFLKMFSHH